MHFAFCIYRRFVRWAFARFYREFAWSYDTVAWLVSRGLWRRWILSVLPFLQGRVLELGFGTGYLQLARADYSTIGLEASPQMIARTSARLRRAGKPVRLLRGLAQALPFATASFDTVVATFPADYVLEAATHSEIRRVLAPGGRLVILDAARFTNNGPYEWLVDLAYKLTFQGSVRRRSAAFRMPGSDEGRRTNHAEPHTALLLPGFSFQRQLFAVGPSEALILIGTRDSD